MGQGQSVGYSKDTINLETYRKEAGMTQDAVNKAFTKCTDRTKFTAEGSPKLEKEEKQCVQEYAMLYANYCKTATQQMNHHQEQLMREMMERMRQEHMKRARG